MELWHGTIMLVNMSRKMTTGVKLGTDFMITPKGIEFLQENSAMNIAKEFLKTLKETIPGL